MPYDEFIANHPELHDLDQGTKDIAYQMHLEQLQEALSEID